MSPLSERIQEYLPLLVTGLWQTVAVTLLSLVLASALGLMWALMRSSGNRWLSLPARYIVEFLRGIPILVVLFYIYFVMPEIGLDLTAFQAGVMGLALTYSCYIGETFRGGIEAVDRGQIEAAKSIGMKHGKMMRRIVVPQAFRIALPPYGNNMVMLLKDSSQVSVISVAELTMQGKMLASSTFDNMTVFTMVAALYLCLTIPLNFLMRRVELKMGAST
ncbi:amino acid ABC transporter permease (plasmid) [Alloyangia pacifica]|uniref:Putative glutamine transport system permease protein GlnP n=1 Tax=Alloyangia pacifica TaxID=311180 RepID=A0A2U8HLA9_9RHOB|nr:MULTISPECIES: amino acid ABC transporter permease [Roseobacteraceae]AWI86553.1 amino acid ABC transporter permease [Alloyangia pacifica]NDV48870.1 amino acid ABC transporter permease [Salipiger sp. PrR003]NDW31133.1 amino acid ABC transporter permease [Salipiger sp. PrR007]